jgi:hypothetical protein
MLTKKPWRWLASTYRLQSEVYDYPLEVFIRGAQANATAQQVAPLANYIQWNMFSAFVEIAEASVEFSWKPWAVDLPFVNRDRIIDEIIDVNHFLGNILTAVGCTDDEYERRYQAKQQKNTDRVESGTYSAKKGGLGEGSDV